MYDAREIRAEIVAGDVPELTVEIDAGPPELEVEIIAPEEALELGINPAIYRGEPGKAPRIGIDDCWEVYDNESGAWLNTGIFARGGISDYEELDNRPRINGNELIGDKTAHQLVLENHITNSEIEALFQD